MPSLRKIVVQNFRNIELQELEFSPNVNCITGGNGEGKTNLLEAIWYLSMTKSSFSASDRFNFRHGSDSFAIGGTYRMQDAPELRIALEVSRGGAKTLRRDDKPCTRLSDHIGLLPIVMVSPADVAMVSESGDGRRRFANAVISQMDSAYLHSLQQYLRLLSQRNSLLHSDSPDPALLEVLDGRMSPLSDAVAAGREKFVRGLNPLVSMYYERISGGAENVSVSYRTELEGRSFEELMRSNRRRDLAMGYTTSGIQRDDFLFSMDGHPIRRCGSQGQQKSFLVALKFAQYSLMKSISGHSPMLLLDDLFDKLDMGRVQNLLQMVSGAGFGQIFLSDSNKVRISGIVDSLTSDRTYYEAAGGAFTRV